MQYMTLPSSFSALPYQGHMFTLFYNVLMHCTVYATPPTVSKDVKNTALRMYCIFSSVLKCVALYRVDKYKVCISHPFIKHNYSATRVA